MTTHPFNSGGATGTPDRPCVTCGLPDRDPIHRGVEVVNPIFETTWVRCGNCKKQYEVPVEQPFRYHAVMQHKFSCPAGAKEAVESQRAQLIAEFTAQQARQTSEKTRRRGWLRRFVRWFL
jgi:hypothetical protein